MTTLLAFIFVLSGAAGLIYESIWSRYLGLLVGHSAYAQVIVLVIFLGGMSAGAAIAARFSSRIREPLLWYAAIEGIVGLVGLVFHDIFTATSGFAYDTLFPALAGGTTLLVVKWLLAAVLILPQSILLGTTFPLMTAGVLRRVGDAAAPKGSGAVLGLLYFANSFGAAMGVLLAGFWLIKLAGLPGTLLVAAMLNLSVALATFLLVRVHPATDPAPLAPAPALPAADDAGLRGRLWRLLLGASFFTAIASFIYEIAWIRMLSLVLGSATHAFELMLSAFIFGLALGALFVRKAADDTPDTIRLLGLVQIAMGVLAIGTLGSYLGAFDWMATLLNSLQRNEGGYALFNVARYGFALAVMLPATFCAGMTLPLITRSLLAVGAGERAIGAVYAWNTLGSIVGVALASLVLLPALGLRGLLILGGAIDLIVGIWLLWWRTQDAPKVRRTASVATIGGVAVIVIALLSPGFDPVILTSGVFRYGSVPAPGSRTIAYYQDGRTATVSVQFGDDSSFTISTNGKPDASLKRTWFDEPNADSSKRPALRGDDATQVLLPLVTLAHAPNAQRAAVIGHGSGMSSHFLLGSESFRSVTTIDIEPEMIEASRLLLPANVRVFDDPRSIFVIDDAKSYFASSGQEFDLILSEPSNPWVSGVSGLFTDEFYERVGTYLAPGGIFGQWLHLYEIEDQLVLSILAALDRHFASWEIFLTNDVDVLVVASNEARLPRPDWTVFERPDIARDLSRFRRITPEVLESTRLITSDELAPLMARNPPPNSDFFPRLDLGAERARFLQREATAFSVLPVERWDLAAALGERRIGFIQDPSPALTHNRLVSQGVGIQMRSTAEAPDSGAVPRRTQIAKLRRFRLELEMATARPPIDWQIWWADAMVTERDLHQGTMGIVDTAFYSAVEEYLTSVDAPAGPLAALRFQRAASTYDWTGAAREVEFLLEERSRGATWVHPGFLLDAAVLARLRSGDVIGARAAFVRLAASSGRPLDDLRTLLLDSHVMAAEQSLQKDRPAAGKDKR